MPFERGFGSKAEATLSAQMREYSLKHWPQKPFQVRVVGHRGPEYKIVFVDFLVRGGLVVEVDGRRHNSTRMSAADSSRDARLVEQGKCKEVIRVTNRDVRSGTAIRRIMEWLGEPGADRAQAECDCRKVRARVTADSFFVD